MTLTAFGPNGEFKTRKTKYMLKVETSRYSMTFSNEYAILIEFDSSNVLIEFQACGTFFLYKRKSKLSKTSYNALKFLL